METPQPRVGHWILGSVIFVGFVGTASILFEAASQPLPRPGARAATGVAKAYRPVSIEDPDVRTALQVALNDQKSKNRAAAAVKLLSVLAAERQTSSGDNFRLCLSLDRRGRTDTARVVVQRTPKNKWSVALWAWGACGK